MTNPPPEKTPIHKLRRPALFFATSLSATFAAFVLLHDSDVSAPDRPRPKPSPTASAKATAASVEDSATAKSEPPASPVDSRKFLTETDPRRAIALALAEKDDTHRLVLLRDILRNWAMTDPDAAANWALSHQAAIEQGHAFSAIFNGTQLNPETTLRLARRLATEHPQEAQSFGRHAIHNLAQAGHFEPAANLAATSHPDHLVDLLTAVYHPWGCQQPEKALQSAIAFEDPLRQNAAFEAVIGGWAQTNPQSLTEAAYKFPQGNDRSLALVTGLRSWIEKDPASAEAWIKSHKLTAEESARALEE